MIAVAANDCVYYIKDFSQSMQFKLPLILFSAAESSIWANLMKLTKMSMQSGDDATESSQETDLVTWPELIQKLLELRAREPLSKMSSRLLSLENQTE